VAGRTFRGAALSGRAQPKNEAAALQQLKDWMTAAGLRVLSPPVFAYFDPRGHPVSCAATRSCFKLRRASRNQKILL